MQFEGTVTLINDTKVAIVVVDQEIVNDPQTAGQTLADYQKRVFRGTPTVLFGRGSDGRGLQYFGPPAIVAELSKVDPRRFRWHRYTLGN
jgi:hypothetical protein